MPVTQVWGFPQALNATHCGLFVECEYIEGKPKYKNLREDLVKRTYLSLKYVWPTYTLSSQKLILILAFF